MEEKNLFLIHHVQEEEKNLDDIKKRAQFDILSKKNEVKEVKSNITHLKDSTKELRAKEAFFAEKTKQNQEEKSNEEEELISSSQVMGNRDVTSFKSAK